MHPNLYPAPLSEMMIYQLRSLPVQINFAEQYLYDRVLHLRKLFLKGLCHEIDFKNVDKNLQNLA
jgi:hypothetical protein